MTSTPSTVAAGTASSGGNLDMEAANVGRHEQSVTSKAAQMLSESGTVRSQAG
jgi:hypothetical protein